MLIGFSFFTVVIDLDVLVVVPISWLKKKIAYFNYVSTWTSLLNMMFASLTMCPLGLDFDKFLLLNMMNLNYDFECLHYYDYFGGVFPFETLACFLFFLI